MIKHLYKIECEEDLYHGQMVVVEMNKSSLDPITEARIAFVADTIYVCNNKIGSSVPGNLRFGFERVLAIGWKKSPEEDHEDETDWEDCENDDDPNEDNALSLCISNGISAVYEHENSKELIL